MLTPFQRQWLAVGFVVCATLFSGYYSFFVKPSKVLVEKDGVAKWEERMESVRKSLPPSVREVGYVSDNDPVAMVQEYSLTRYALAPIVVRQSVSLEWIIGNFTQAGLESILSQKIPSGFTVKKLGAGIYLIHRGLP
jgi:hypothetical protein